MNAQQYPPKTLNNIRVLNNIKFQSHSTVKAQTNIPGKSAQQYLTFSAVTLLNNILALNNIRTQTAQQYPVQSAQQYHVNRSTISNTLNSNSAQQYPTTLNSNCAQQYLTLDNIRQSFYNSKGLLRGAIE